jgi:macrolide transport system ATP-binding/permease protein
MVESLLKDLRYALRWIARSPGFSAVAILSLGLGVGVNTAMFSLVDSLLFRPLPVTAPETLVDVFTSAGDGDEYATSSYADYLDLKAQNTVFSDLTGYSPMVAPLNLGDRSRISLGQIVTSNHFEMLGVRPFLGRLLVPSDDEPGAARVVVLSYRMWQREFGGDPAIVGQSITLRGQRYEIAGVAPAEFTGVVALLTPEVWLPIQYAEEVEPAGMQDSVPSPIGSTRLERRGMRWMFVKGRLKPGVSAAQAHANVALVGRQLAAEHVMTNKDRSMAAVPTEDVRLLVPQADDSHQPRGAARSACGWPSARAGGGSSSSCWWRARCSDRSAPWRRSGWRGRWSRRCRGSSCRCRWKWRLTCASMPGC